MVKLIPKYSYEYNVILNSDFDENENIKNFASLISDKDRFLPLVKLIENNSDLIEDRLGMKLKEEIEFYIVRCEKFKSFSDPITIEYSVYPEEIIIFLLKEIIKISIDMRFPDDVSRENSVNNLARYIIKNGSFEGNNFEEYLKNLYDESKRLFLEYEFLEIDFSKLTMKDHIEKLYEEML